MYDVVRLYIFTFKYPIIFTYPISMTIHVCTMYNEVPKHVNKSLLENSSCEHV